MRQGMLRSGVLSPSRRPWAGPSGPAAIFSGRAGLSGRRSFLGAGGRAGRMPGDAWFFKPGLQAYSRPQAGHQLIYRHALTQMVSDMRAEEA